MNFQSISWSGDLTIYVDNAAIIWKGKARYHLTADSLDELHRFAQAIGIKRCWFHPSKKFPHYDITQQQRSTAIAEGASAVDSKMIVKLKKIS